MVTIAYIVKYDPDPNKQVIIQGRAYDKRGNPVRWAITRGQGIYCLSRSLKWDREIAIDKRTEEWLGHHRYSDPLEAKEFYDKYIVQSEG